MRYGRILRLVTRKRFLVMLRLAISLRREFVASFRSLIRVDRLGQHSGMGRLPVTFAWGPMMVSLFTCLDGRERFCFGR
jgi:hypothetical protein